jgi:hypothetical protein
MHVAPLVAPDVRSNRRARDAQRRAAIARTPRERHAVLEAWLRAAREHRLPRDVGSTLAALERNVCALEAEVALRSEAERRAPEVLRRALTLLRDFGHLALIDLACLPPELRPAVVRLLALEHRWSFAAAGTTQRDLHEVSGRSGFR